MKCQVEGCDRSWEGPKLKLCKSHAQRYRKSGWREIYCGCGFAFPISSRSRVCPNCNKCTIINCNKIIHQKGYCTVHYMQWYRYGENFQEVNKCACGADVYGKNRIAKYCLECSKKAKKNNYARHSIRRRYDVQSEKYDREYIFRLDSYKCYLCNEYVQPEDRTIDHIVPLSKGGKDMITNVALTHWNCNYVKRARLPEDVKDIFPNYKIPVRA